MAITKDQVRYENNIIYTPNFDEEPDSRGIGYVYFESMSKYKNNPAQVDGPSGTVDTFGDLLQRCVRTAITLREKGVKYGDMISVCTYNHINSCVPHISAMFLGAKMAALDPSLSPSDAEFLFRQVMPKLIFTGTESVKLIENVINEVGSDTILVVFGPGDKHISFSTFIGPRPDELVFRPVEVSSMQDVALILFSSGTTGLPKGICHTHHSILRSGCFGSNLSTSDALTFSTDSPYWNIFHIYLHNSLRNGGARLIYPQFDVNNPWMIFDHKVTMVYLDITRLLILCNTPKPSSVDCSSLRLIAVGGTPITEEQMHKLRSVFSDAYVRQNYGLSEVFPNVTLFDVSVPEQLEFMKQKPNSCGFVKRGICYKVVDPETEEVLSFNQKGEIRLKTEMQLKGYYNVDSSNIWDADGWLKTGDYGYYDEDYCFYVIDRFKEMFRYCDWPIIPILVERVLLSHPKIFRAVVIGIPHYLDNHHAIGVVILKPDSGVVTEEEIVKYVEERVEDRLKLRAGVKFVKSFPLTPSGKVSRLKLKTLILENKI